MSGTKVAGVDVLVKVGSPAIAVGGQSGATLNRSMNVIETTDKTSGGWVTKVGGIKEWSVECEAFMVIGDEGYKALSDAFKDRSEIDVEMATGVGTGHVTFKGKALISDFPVEMAQDDAVTFSITLEGTGELVETITAGV